MANDQIRTEEIQAMTLAWVAAIAAAADALVGVLAEASYSAHMGGPQWHDPVAIALGYAGAGTLGAGSLGTFYGLVRHPKWIVPALALAAVGALIAASGLAWWMRTQFSDGVGRIAWIAPHWALDAAVVSLALLISLRYQHVLLELDARSR